MVDQAKDLKLEKDRSRLSHTRKEKTANRELENARKKKASFWRKQDLRVARENCICLSCFNPEIYIFFVT